MAQKPLEIAWDGSDFELTVSPMNGGFVEMEVRSVISNSTGSTERWPFPALTTQEARTLAERLIEMADRQEDRYPY